MENSIATIPSITFLLRNVSDDKALTLFNSIAISRGHKYIPLKEMNLTTKQYYSRISGLLNAGLIRRHKGKYCLTLLGKIVYYSQMTIGKTLSYYWKLKAIESIQMSSDTKSSEEEIVQLIDALIDDHNIKDILIKPISSGHSKELLPAIACGGTSATTTIGSIERDTGGDNENNDNNGGHNDDDEDDDKDYTFQIESDGGMSADPESVDERVFAGEKNIERINGKAFDIKDVFNECQVSMFND